MRTDRSHSSHLKRKEARHDPSMVVPVGSWKYDAVAGTEPTASLSAGSVSLDSELVTEAKSRIHRLVRELNEAASSSLDAMEFARIALPKVMHAMGASGICLLIWTRPVEKQSGASWRIVTPVSMPAPLLNDSWPIDTDGVAPLRNSRFQPSYEHEQILNEVQSESQPVLVPPREVPLSKTRPLNPTSSHLLIVPIPFRFEEGEIWLEVVQSPSGGPTSQRGQLRFACQMAEIFAGFYRRYESNSLQHEKHFMLELEQWLEEGIGGTRQDAQRALSNSLELIRKRSHADHTILLTRGSHTDRWQVIGVAGLTRIDRRTDGLQAVEAVAPVFDRHADGLAVVDMITNQHPQYEIANSEELGQFPETSEADRFRKTLAVERCIWCKPYAVQTSALGATSCLSELLGDSAAGSIVKPSEDNVALMLAWSEDKNPPRDCIRQASLILRIASNAPSFNGGWWSRVYPVARRRGWRPFEKPRLTRMAGAVLILAAVVAVFSFPVPMQIESTAVLVPRASSELFATQEGIISAVHVRHGQSVLAGDVCVELDSPKLRSEWEQSLAGHVKSQQRLKDVEGRLLRDRELASAERDTLETERDTLLEIIGIEQRGLDLIQKQIDQLIIRSPASGVVETWDVDTSLRDRPVQVGQWLFSIRDDKAGWELNASVPERRLEELLGATEKPSHAYARLVSIPDVKIPVAFTHGQGWRKTGSMADKNMSESSRSSRATAELLQVRFQVDGPIPSPAQVTGSSARVTVQTGKAPLFWVLGRDLVEDVVMRLRMWYP